MDEFLLRHWTEGKVCLAWSDNAQKYILSKKYKLFEVATDAFKIDSPPLSAVLDPFVHECNKNQQKHSDALQHAFRKPCGTDLMEKKKQNWTKTLRKAAKIACVVVSVLIQRELSPQQFDSL